MPPNPEKQTEIPQNESTLQQESTESKIKGKVEGKDFLVVKVEKDKECKIPVFDDDIPVEHSGSSIIFFVDGSCQDVAFKNINRGTYYPAISLFGGASVSVNFGPYFKYPPPDYLVPNRYFPASQLVPLIESGYEPTINPKKRKEMEETSNQTMELNTN